MKKHNFIFACLLILTGISHAQVKDGISFSPGSIDAKKLTLNGIPVLKGPSVLLDTGKLVWGAN